MGFGKAIGKFGVNQATQVGAGVAVGSGLMTPFTENSFLENTQEMVWSENQSFYDNLLDIASLVPVIGEAVDLLHGLSYIAKAAYHEGVGEGSPLSDLAMSGAYFGSFFLPSVIGAAAVKGVRKSVGGTVKEVFKQTHESLHVFNRATNVINGIRRDALLMIPGFYKILPNETREQFFKRQGDLYEQYVLSPGLNINSGLFDVFGKNKNPFKNFTAIRDNIAREQTSGLGTLGVNQISDYINHIDDGAKKISKIMDDELIPLIDQRYSIIQRGDIGNAEWDILHKTNLEIANKFKEINGIQIDAIDKKNVNKKLSHTIWNQMASPEHEKSKVFQLMEKEMFIPYSETGKKIIMDYLIPVYKEGPLKLDVRKFTMKIVRGFTQAATGTSSPIIRDKSFRSLQNFLSLNSHLLGGSHNEEFVKTLRDVLALEKDKLMVLLKNSKDSKNKTLRDLSHFLSDSSESQIEDFLGLANKHIDWKEGSNLITVSTRAASRSNFVQGTVSLEMFIDTKNLKIGTMSHDVLEGNRAITNFFNNRFIHKLFPVKFPLLINPITWHNISKKVSLSPEYQKLGNEVISKMKKDKSMQPFIKNIDDVELRARVQMHFKNIVKDLHGGYVNNPHSIAEEVFTSSEQVNKAINSYLLRNSDDFTTSVINTGKLDIQKSEMPDIFKYLATIQDPYKSAAHGIYVNKLMKTAKFTNSSVGLKSQKGDVVRSGFTHFDVDGRKVSIKFLTGKSDKEVKTALKDWGSIKQLQNVDKLHKIVNKRIEDAEFFFATSEAFRRIRNTYMPLTKEVLEKKEQN